MHANMDLPSGLLGLQHSGNAGFLPMLALPARLKVVTQHTLAQPLTHHVEMCAKLDLDGRSICSFPPWPQPEQKK